MKKILLLFATIGLLVSCNKRKNEEKGFKTSEFKVFIGDKTYDLGQCMLNPYKDENGNHIVSYTPTSNSQFYVLLPPNLSVGTFNRMAGDPDNPIATIPVPSEYFYISKTGQVEVTITEIGGKGDLGLQQISGEVKGKFFVFPLVNDLIEIRARFTTQAM